MRYPPIYMLFFISLLSCNNENSNNENYLSQNPNAFEVVITTPAGETDTQSFLPYPGNMGYLGPDKQTAILVLASHVKPGTTLVVEAIATLIIKEENTLKNIIIGTPIDSTIQLSQVTNFQNFITKNAGEKQIIQDWFLYQKGIGSTELVGWKDERYAFDLVKEFIP